MAQMPFGKFKGCYVEDLPDAYVGWLLNLNNLCEPLASALRDEATRRGLYREFPRPRRFLVPSVVSELIEAGFRSIAKRAHPDVGGSDEAMRDAIAARDYLHQVAGASR
jgi:hypothetical protein